MKHNSDLSKGWLSKGDSDFKTAKLIAAGDGPYDTACFHAQQAVEKYLKSLLAFYGLDIPRTHDLEELQLICVQFVDFKELSLEELSNYAVSVRYDFEFWPDIGDVKVALIIVEKIRKCLKQESIPVYGDGTNIRDWLYVTDHCSGTDAVVRRGRLGEVYNIGGINKWANIDICKLICSLMDEHKPKHAPHADLITFVQDRSGHDWCYAIDATKMNDELDSQPAETFETGCERL